MAQRDIIDAFNDCIDRLNNGATVADCLRLYPQYADDLRVMLDAGRLVNRARIDPFETQAAQQQGRDRVLDAFATTPPRSNIYPFRRFMTLAATLVLILGLFMGGAGLAAESSLPGDPLYGLKRLTEDARLILPGATTDLKDAFARRRVDEIRQLLAINRAENVDFSGEVEAINADAWVIAGLPVTVPPGTPGAESIKVSDEVAVQAQTTASGQLTATNIALLDSGDVQPTPTSTPTLSATPSPTMIPTASPTQTALPTLTHTPSPSALPVVATSPTPAACVAAAPPGWVTYQVSSGDTLSGLASATGVLMDAIIAANCLETTTIFVGQSLYLPFVPQTVTSPGQTPPESGGGATSSGGSNDDDDGDDDSDDDDDDEEDDNSGPGSHDDDDDEDRSGSNSGPG